ncbi:MAG: hypothetical protein AAF386_07250 [Pseudomonadota bacterium]
MSKFYKIALNHAWKLRDDFDAHLYLDGLAEEHRPPKEYRARSVNRNHFRAPMAKAGGPYMCSMTAAISAGYWIIQQGSHRIVSYYGCDMVYQKDEANHFYGHGGDKGPMMGNFVQNSDYAVKYSRLFVFGLLNRVLFLNSSGQEGTQLPLPILPMGREFPMMVEWVLSHPVAQTILRHGLEALIAEQNLKTDVFKERLQVFNKSKEAKEILQQISEQWVPVVEAMPEMSDIVRKMLDQRVPLPT